MISAELSVVLTDINSEIKRKNDVNQDAESLNLNLSEKSNKYKSNKRLPKNKDKNVKTEQKMKSKDFYEVQLKKNSFAVGKSFKDLMYAQEHDPGGGRTLHCFYDDLKDLSKEDYQQFVDEFLDLALSEEKENVPKFSMAVMHGGAVHLPDLLEYISENYPSMVAKRMLLGKSDVETTTLQQYYELVKSSYAVATYRCGPLLQLSMVGKANEESGEYMEDLLEKMEQNQLIKDMMPWGERSCLHGTPRQKSNDGPILWCRCGEQVVPPMDSNNKSTPRKRGINELKRLQYLPRVSEGRESVVEDRTKCHADQVGGLLQKQATAAVGVLKGIYTGSEARSGRRVVKEVVCVDAQHFEQITQRLKLDLLEPPMSQCVTWLDEARLNQLNREGIQTAKVTLRDNDVYVIPRNVVHQFKTVSATASVAWHVRLKQYHKEGQCLCGLKSGAGIENNQVHIDDTVSFEDKNKNYKKKKKKLSPSGEENIKLEEV